MRRFEIFVQKLQIFGYKLKVNRKRIDNDISNFNKFYKNKVPTFIIPTQRITEIL